MVVKYTEVIDLQTTPNKMTILGIHTPTGLRPHTMLRGLFGQFRKFKYHGCNVRMVNAAQLPVDPLGVSGIPGTTDVMDPRDALNPILFHGCHGDHLNDVLDMIYKEGRYEAFTHSTASVDDQEVSIGIDANYYAALSDPSWKKFGIQSGVSLRGLKPLVHKAALTKQMVPTSQSTVYDYVSGQDVGKMVTDPAIWDVPAKDVDDVTSIIGVEGTVPSGVSGKYERNINQMFTNGVQRLGWLPTSSWYVNAAASALNGAVVTYLPKIFMGILILPPCYKQVQFFRLCIDHYFSFKDFTTYLDTPNFTYVTPANAYADWIDHSSSKDEPIKVELSDDMTIEAVNGEAQLVTDGVSS